ncbi:SMC-Scp complex subunit ScpB [Nakamurella sp.]|uniref:SMC-Scp complex subunit ScpB n=1 Tax=Nakamurella sp. TaxID=1869182 RepID=UPI003783D250
MSGEVQTPVADGGPPVDAPVVESGGTDPAVVDAEAVDAAAVDAVVIGAVVVDAEVVDAEVVETEVLDAEVVETELVVPDMTQAVTGEAVAETPDEVEPTGAAGDPAPAPGAQARPGPAEPVDQVPEHDLAGAIEAVLLVADTPLPEAQIAAAVGHTPGHVRTLLAELADNYTAANSGIELREFGGGWRFYTRDRFAPVVERFVLDGAQSRLSKAALETLAVVAYRQPVTRARIAAVRGVNVDGVIRTLMSRGLIQDCGIDADTGGTLYRSTDLFLDRMGLDDLAELPSLGPMLPDIGELDDV